ncbi:hypothetical protein VJ923_07090 [Adlercreutzia sp. R25]|uniref:hypothetical protein n=1 Tax=Adlercreutzia shanghongiae TaxID=3111773 RepID=UPI002DC01710|nr:hypothetical protein [Adlercreutzia sp. R25]MEC4272919.1 hypothetical protein [Adlercreutzia sp. R25]
MCEIREEIRRLCKELGISQTELARQLTAQGRYRVNSSEFSQFMQGLNTPKGNRVLTDALALLVNERDYRENLVRRAKHEEVLPGTCNAPAFTGN